MSDTKSGSSQSNVSPTKQVQSAVTQPMGSRNSSAQSSETKSQSKSLSTSVAEHLLLLMQTVTANEVNPQTVNAACNCATQMINLMKLNMKLRDS